MEAVAASAQVKPWYLPPSQRGGVIFMAIIGSVSVLSLLLLLVHVISISFIPLCLSALNIQPAPESTTHHSSTGYPDIRSSMGVPEIKSNITGVQSSTGIKLDLDRTGVLEERRARARALSLSRQLKKNKEERLFLRMQLGVFIVCMLLSDLIQSSGVLIQARWAYLGRVEPGKACWVQGAMITFGDVGTAVWNTVIACHTFATVVLGVRMSTPGICIVVICGWTFPIMMNVVGSMIMATPENDYYSVVGAWCFIANAYATERVTLHYVPLLFASFAITVMYTLVSLTMRGNLQVTPASSHLGIPWYSVSFTINRASSSGNTNQKQVAYLRSLSLKMLWYPCVYIGLTLPISICRVIGLESNSTTFPILFCGMVLLFLVGLSNVAIYVATRNVGIQRNTKVVNSIKTPHRGTQVDITIDRVTRYDRGVTTIGGTHISGRERSTIRVDDIKMDETSSQNSWYRDIHDAKSSNSTTQLGSTSPTYITQPPSPEELDSLHPSPLPRFPVQTRNLNRSPSIGSVTTDRFGVTPAQDHGAPFQRPIAERPNFRHSFTPVSSLARSVSPSAPGYPYATAINETRTNAYAWEQLHRSMRSIG